MMFLSKVRSISGEKMERILFRCIYIIMAVIFFLQMLDADGGTSIMFHALLLVIVLTWIVMQRCGLTKMDLFVCGIILLAIVFVVVNGVLSGADLSFSYMKKVILFSIALLFLQIANRRETNAEDTTFLYCMINIITLLFVVMFFVQGTYKYWYVNRISPYLTFKFSNPNLVAMILLCLFMFHVSWLFSKKYRKLKWVHLAFAAFLAYCIFETRARNSQLVLLCFLIGCLILLCLRRSEFRLGKILSAVVCVFPALFFSIYMAVINSLAFQRMFHFLVSEGKDLDSRVNIWGPALAGVKESPIIGAYYAISNGTGTGQMHSTHLDVLASYGAIVLVLVCIFLFLLLYQNGRQYDSKLKVAYMIGFCGTILMGMGEAAVFSGGLGLFVLVGTFLAMAKGEEAALHIR